MIDLGLVRSIESASYRSWKARECVAYDGWQLRYADGFSRRGNSVYPAEISTLPLDEKLGHCRVWYRERDLDLVVRQTPASEPGLDAELAARAFSYEGATNVMSASIGGRKSIVEVADEPSREWWATTAGLWNLGEESRLGWEAIIAGLDQPAGFLCIPSKAAGLGIVAGDWVGLFEIVVAPQLRRRGLGTAVAESLLSWGAQQGAGRAYLQVVAENAGAIRYYRSLGFTRCYQYWYRRDPKW